MQMKCMRAREHTAKDTNAGALAMRSIYLYMNKRTFKWDSSALTLRLLTNQQAKTITQ